MSVLPPQIILGVHLIIVRSHNLRIRSRGRGRVGTHWPPWTLGGNSILGVQSIVIVHCGLSDFPFGLAADSDCFEVRFAHAVSTHKTSAIHIQLVACREMILSNQTESLTASPLPLK